MAFETKLLELAHSRVRRKNSNWKPFWIYDLLNKDISLRRAGISDKKKENFYSELGILLSSGIDLRSSLEIFIDEQENDRDKTMYSNVYHDVIRGESLSIALEKTKSFNLYDVYSLKIGEESGKVREVLNDLALFYTRKIKQKRQIISAFTYPVMVIITAFVAIFFMLRFIVPMFSEVFNRFKGELPPLTKFIVLLSHSMARNFSIFLILLTCLVTLYFIFKDKPVFRSLSSRILMRLPFFGKIVNKVYLARFCQSMALLTSSRIPMLRSIQLVKKMIRFYPFEEALMQVEIDILDGKLLHKSMQQFPIFDKRVVALTRVGEEVNQLDKIFLNLNTQYNDELEHQVVIIGNLLEPLMIILVGIMVAVILISIYLPLFQLSTTIM